MLDLDGKVLMWIGSTTDVDDARRLMDELSRSDRAKDDFLAALSHELRTPLAPVLLIAATLRENKNLSKDVHDQIDVIEHNIGLEARLIDDLLDITKISHGKLLFRAELCDAHRLIDSTLEIVRDDAEAKHILIERNLAAKHSRLMADPTRFQQVVWNLLRNAVKFTPFGGKISVATREARLADGKIGLRIEIGDSGVGIAAENLEKIFDAFEQGHRTSNHQFGGLGLGLTIARAVVKLHGGTITAYSAGLNLGASFVVELPGVIDTAAPFPIVTGRVAEAKQPVNRLNLLLVEDHTDTRNALKALLMNDGYKISAAATVAQALEIAGAQKFDLVISDLGLPDGSGTALMEKLRDRHGLVGIALTGYGMEENMAQTRASGFIAHLVKPVSADELKRTIVQFAENLKDVTH